MVSLELLLHRGVTKLSPRPQKRILFLLGVHFKIPNVHPHSFYIGVPLDLYKECEL